MKIVNMTPYTINIYDDNFKVVNIYKSEGKIKLTTHRYKVKELDGIPVYNTIVCTIEGLPKFNKDIIYIVTKSVAKAMKQIERYDCVTPDETVWDIDGTVIGYKSFAVI